MGVSTDAILFYGYNLGGGDSEWEIEGTGQYGDFAADWHDPEDEDSDGFAEDANNRLRVMVGGFTETDWQVDGYWERQREADQRVGVEVSSHCSAEYPVYYIAACAITAWRGSPKRIDFAKLEAERAEGDWDQKLAVALEALGMTPKQAKPQWLLVSDWG